MRCVHEASLYDENCFVTLTYDDEHLPGRSLVYRDFQLFLKRLRRRFSRSRIRFFMCGEYGELTARPHFHACLFNFDFPDKKAFKQTSAGPLFRSDALESLWSFGLSSIGQVTFESAAYVARYVVKKMTGPSAVLHYVDSVTGEVREPEFCHMSLKPGIGAVWLQRYWSEVYPSGTVVMRGKAVPPPRFYNRRAKHFAPEEYAQFEEARARLLGDTRADRVPERLEVREAVVQSLLSKTKRSL